MDSWKAPMRLAASAMLLAAAAAHAQDVHKCTVNGAVTYQAQPCPSGDVVLQAPPTPSDQEVNQARGDLQRQRFQAATGWIVPPRIVRPPRLNPRQPPASPTKAQSNCAKLNQDYVEAQDRRAQLRHPSEVAAHDEMLRKAEADVARIEQLAVAGNCNLGH
jgi:hypothetical protein